MEISNRGKKAGFRSRPTLRWSDYGQRHDSVCVLAYNGHVFGSIPRVRRLRRRTSDDLLLTLAPLARFASLITGVALFQLLAVSPWLILVFRPDMI